MNAPASANQAVQEVSALVKAGRCAEAFLKLPQAVAEAKTPVAISFCLCWVQMVAPSFRRRGYLQKLLDNTRAAQAGTVRANQQAGFASCTLSLLLALHAFPNFLKVFEETETLIGGDKNAALFRAVYKRIKLPPSAVYKEPKVFGIGLSRTATTSLSLALTTLGIDNGHWTNPLTMNLLDEVDFYMLGGASDIPVAADFEALAYTYPNAKFIYTTRPKASWLTSVTRHYEAHTDDGQFETARRQIEDPSNWRYGHRSTGIHARLYLNHTDLSEAYDAHDARIRRFFESRKDRLLTLNVFEGQGWPELAAFLGRAAPDRPFPRSNEAKG